MSAINLAKKVILVTGAGQGMGNALCNQLVEVGAKVIGLVQTTEQMTEMKSTQPSIETMQVDLRDWQCTREALSSVQQLDGLVNVAGIAIIKPFGELCEQDFDATVDINFKAVFNVSQVLAPKLRDGSGSIVNIASLSATRSFDGHTVYCATKAAVDSFTRSLALELGPRKIRVNSINPAVVMTKMGRDVWSEPSKAEPMLARIPLRRFCEVQEVVDAIIYLLSSSSSFVNGHHLNIDGGFSVA